MPSDPSSPSRFVTVCKSSIVSKARNPPPLTHNKQCYFLHVSSSDNAQSTNMLEFRTQGFNGYAVKYSPFFDSKIAVASSANYGLVGNGRLHILSLTSNGIVAEKWCVFFSLLSPFLSFLPLLFFAAIPHPTPFPPKLTHWLKV